MPYSAAASNSARAAGDLFVVPCLLLLVTDLQVRQGLYYNPYFPGGAIAMPRMLADGGVEYDDGTPSNSSQQAKVRRCHRVLVAVQGSKRVLLPVGGRTPGLQQPMVSLRAV